MAAIICFAQWQCSRIVAFGGRSAGIVSLWIVRNIHKFKISRTKAGVAINLAENGRCFHNFIQIVLRDATQTRGLVDLLFAGHRWSQLPSNLVM